jgi:pimeloyl-ACP methyl ester carboxylesterase
LRRVALPFVLVLAVLLAACSTPVGVARMTTADTKRETMVNALSSGTPSQWTLQVLNRNGLLERHEQDAAGAIDDLYALVKQHSTPDGIFALAELAFLHGQHFNIPAYYLNAAVLAYAFLLPDDEMAGVSPLDPRARIAVDIYNEGLALGLGAVGSEYADLRAGVHDLPLARLTITADPGQFVWAGYRLQRFYPTVRLKVRGLRNRYRQAGVGATMAADIEPAGSGAASDAARKRIPPKTKVPVTAFLRVENPLEGVLAGNLQARLEIYTADSKRSLRVGERNVPLEFESTAAIAYQLDGAAVWSTEFTGFRQAEAPVFGDGLITLQPYRPGLIPVVFVHGTASSPARWAEMYNELSNDPELKHHYQFWLFQYNTGQPVLYSALLLRRGLQALVGEVDPSGSDAALRRMVIIGHSQGGLLTKLMAVESGSAFWDNVSEVPLDEADLPADTKALMRDAMFFHPVPQLERVVFIATPHQGSFRAVSWLASVMRRIIRAPVRLGQAAQSMQSLPGAAEAGMTEVPTSVDNMNPESRFTRTLAATPFAPRIKAHSIIPVMGVGPPENLDDGVVAYRSAHIDDVESELVVRSNHSTQATPATIEEVRRILREHLEAGAAR